MKSQHVCKYLSVLKSYIYIYILKVSFTSGFNTFCGLADFEIRRTERAENHKDQQYCQVCRSGWLTKIFVCVFCFAQEMQLVCRNDHGQLGIRF